MSVTSDAAATAITNAIEAMAPADVQVLLKVMKEWMAQEEPYWGGGASQPIVIRPDTITTGTRHEIVDGWLGLRKYTDASRITRQIALADSEYGWTWNQRLVLDTANCWENHATYPSEARFKLLGNVSGAERRRYYTNPQTTSQWFVRLRGDAMTVDGQLAGIYMKADGGNWAHLWLERNGGILYVDQYVNGVSTKTAMGVVTAAHVAAGIWICATLDPDGYIVTRYSLSNTPDRRVAVWATLGSGVQWLANRTENFFVSQFAAAPVGSPLSFYFMHWEDLIADAPWGTGNPSWGFQGYDDQSTSQQVLTDYDDGGATSLTEIRALLTGLHAKSGTAATLQCSCKRAAAAGAAPTTWNLPAATVVDGAGDLLSIWLRWISDGTQPGAVLVAPQLVLG